MVKYPQILQSNLDFFSTKAPSNLTAVFVGATSGIGLGALRAFAKHTKGTSPTIYFVGRSSKTLESLRAELSELNPSAKLHPIQANDLTLINDAEAAAQEISKTAGKVDLLIMSPGYIGFKYEESPEGLDRTHTIRYYARMRILVTLTPLLLKSPSPRVVTVLGGGQEGKVFPEDWTLKSNYSIPNAAGHQGSMATLFLEEFAKQPGNEKISLVHEFPGIVGGTGLTLEGAPRIVRFLLDWIVAPAMRWFGYSIEEAGERVLYAATSENFPSSSENKTEGVAKGSNGQAGSGVYLVDGDSSAIPGNKVLTGLREQNTGEGVWAHTTEVFERVERS